MSAIQSYEKVLSALVAEAGVGRLGRSLRRSAARQEQTVGHPGRAWINGHEVAGPKPQYACLHRSYD